MVERSCIHPFIEQTQKALEKGGSFSEQLGKIKEYQNRFNRLVTSVSPNAKISHMVGMSSLGLGTVVVWEYARAHGAPLPDSKEIISLLPVSSITGDGLTEEERSYAQKLRILREENPILYDYVPGSNPTARELQDNHRRGAFGVIDRELECGRIKPKEAERLKKDWDKRHGY